MAMGLSLPAKPISINLRLSGLVPPNVSCPQLRGLRDRGMLRQHVKVTAAAVLPVTDEVCHRVALRKIVYKSLCRSVSPFQCQRLPDRFNGLELPPDLNQQGLRLHVT